MENEPKRKMTWAEAEKRVALLKAPELKHYRTDRSLTAEELQEMFAARKAEATKRGA